MNEMNKKLNEELNNIAFSEIGGKNKSADCVESDLTLYDGRNTQFGYADVKWESSMPEVVNSSGIVMQNPADENVTLKAKFTYQDYPELSGELVFNVTVKAGNRTEEKELDKTKIRIFIAGDSTACNYPHGGENNRFPQTGWGQVFGELFNDAVLVVNCARSGRSSKSFLREENFKYISDNIQEGDYLFIQFAHNDCKAEDTSRFTSPYNNSYQECIYKFIETAKSVNARPVLCTSITRNIMNDTTLLPYAKALKEIGEKEDIPVIDLYKITHGRLEKNGEENSRGIYMHLAPHDERFAYNTGFSRSQYYETGAKDNTHLNINGAREIAGLAAEELKHIQHPLSKYLL